MRRSRKGKRRILLLILAGLAALLLSSVFGLALLFWYVVTAGYHDDAVQSDAIVVLGAAVWPGGEPSPALRARAERGAELYVQGYAPTLVLSGGLGSNAPTEAEAMRRVAVSLGVPDSAIVLDEQSHTTLQSAQNVEAIARERGWKKVIVVSDPFHLMRSSLFLRGVGLSVTTAGTRDDYYDASTRNLHVLRECAGILAYEAHLVEWLERAGVRWYAFSRTWGPSRSRSSTTSG